jgi:predicted DNA-binding transcriptional regulator YafY
MKPSHAEPMPMQPMPVVLDYTNWKGERRDRKVMPLTLWFGVSEFHDTPQWFIRAIDLDRNVMRDFALATIHGVQP